MTQCPAHPVIVVAASANQSAVEAAKALAIELGLRYVGDPSREREGATLALVVGGKRLVLRGITPNFTGNTSVDFDAAIGLHSRGQKHGRDPLARAIGGGSASSTILDATAGLLRDAFALARRGHTVTAVERSPILGALVRDGLAHAAAHGQVEVNDILGRLTFHVADARDFLSQLSVDDAPDVIYLDPMYPSRCNSALTKKQMRICRLLVGDDADAGDLLDLAKQIACRRVVVKRPHHAPPLGERPAFQLAGKLGRFDVYPCTR